MDALTDIVQAIFWCFSLSRGICMGELLTFTERFQGLFFYSFYFFLSFSLLFPLFHCLCFSTHIYSFSVSLYLLYMILLVNFTFHPFIHFFFNLVHAYLCIYVLNLATSILVTTLGVHFCSQVFFSLFLITIPVLILISTCP